MRMQYNINALPGQLQLDKIIIMSKRTRAYVHVYACMRKLHAGSVYVTPACAAELYLQYCVYIYACTAAANRRRVPGARMCDILDLSRACWQPARPGMWLVDK